MLIIQGLRLLTQTMLQHITYLEEGQEKPQQKVVPFKTSHLEQSLLRIASLVLSETYQIKILSQQLQESLAHKVVSSKRFKFSLRKVRIKNGNF